MGKAVPPIAIALLVAALAFAGWQLALGNRQQAQLAGEVAALRQVQQQAQQALSESQESLAALRQEQAQMRRTLSESQESLAAANDKASLSIREDLQAVAAIRTAIAEYYATTGKMPSQHADAGLPSPGQYRGKTLKSATVLADGSIELVFDAASGVDGGRIRFVVDTSRADAMGLQWRCTTTDYPLIKRASPACEYESREGPAVPVADGH